MSQKTISKLQSTRTSTPEIRPTRRPRVAGIIRLQSGDGSRHIQHGRARARRAVEPPDRKELATGNGQRATGNSGSELPVASCQLPVASCPFDLSLSQPPEEGSR